MRMIDIRSHFRLSLLGKANRLIHLDVVCEDNGKYDGLWNIFRNSERLREYINNHTEEACREAICNIEEDHYVLNCQAHEPIFFASEERWLEDQGNMIITFLPIIQKFMGDALAGTLDLDNSKGII